MGMFCYSSAMLPEKWTGAQLASARERKGLTQAELGARVGVNRRTISRIELGDQVPDLELFAKLAGELEMPSLSGESDSLYLSIDEKDLLLDFRQLSEGGKELVRGVLRAQRLAEQAVSATEGAASEGGDDLREKRSHSRLAGSGGR